jgi:L-ribulose-5-phosphate 4-epimerase
MLTELKQAVYEANLALVEEGLVWHTFGNVSGIDREKGVVAIKPSGVDYAELTPENIVLVALDGGKVIEGNLNPSSDTPTHLALYRAFREIGGVAHTHSTMATAWAQGCREVPPLGTTHADYFNGPIPCTRRLSEAEICSDYELNTGHVLVETFTGRDPLSCPGALVASHGPFAWGGSAKDAVHHAAVLEKVVEMACITLSVFPSTPAMQRVLMDKHFFRKHGSNAYYGQSRSAEPPR